MARKLKIIGLTNLGKISKNTGIPVSRLSNLMETARLYEGETGKKWTLNITKFAKKERSRAKNFERAEELLKKSEIHMALKKLLGGFEIQTSMRGVELFFIDTFGEELFGDYTASLDRIQVYDFQNDVLNAAYAVLQYCYEDRMGYDTPEGTFFYTVDEFTKLHTLMEGIMSKILSGKFCERNELDEGLQGAFDLFIKSLGISSSIFEDLSKVRIALPERSGPARLSDKACKRLLDAMDALDDSDFSDEE